jgi:hypothetical protein
MQNDQAPVNLEALSKSAGPVDVTVSPQETTEDAEHRRWKDKIVFLVSVSALVLAKLSRAALPCLRKATEPS